MIHGIRGGLLHVRMNLGKRQPTQDAGVADRGVL